MFIVLLTKLQISKPIIRYIPNYSHKNKSRDDVIGYLC